MLAYVSTGADLLDYPPIWKNLNFLLIFEVVCGKIYTVKFLRPNTRDRKDGHIMALVTTKEMFKKASYYPIISGVCNVFVNTFNIILATSTVVPASVRFPVISVCTLIAVSIFSLFVFKEKLRWWQWIGIGLGVVATVLLSV